MTMIYIFLRILFGFSCICYCDCRDSRRITNGSDVTGDRTYMVYLTRSASAPVKYDAWICGGVILTKLLIVTAAACVEDVQHMYAIAGYVKYVKFDVIDDDPCTKACKKKIVQTCVPKVYEFAYDKLEKWANLDIAAAIVDTAYDFTAAKIPACSYAPNKIGVNFDPEYEKPGLDVFILGWGHALKWRKPADVTDYNNASLQFTTAKILPKVECIEAYKNVSEKFTEIVRKYMICADGSGKIDDNGIPKTLSPDEMQEDVCEKSQVLRDGKCMDIEVTTSLLPSSERSRPKNENSDIYGINIKYHGDMTRKQNQNRRSGICQNDHGGPLMTWVGGRAVMIGVASVFKVNSASECIGPYLYTSTVCNRMFLSCLMSQNKLRSGDHRHRRNLNATRKPYLELETVTYMYEYSSNVKNKPKVIKDTKSVELKDTKLQSMFRAITSYAKEVNSKLTTTSTTKKPKSTKVQAKNETPEYEVNVGTDSEFEAKETNIVKSTTDMNEVNLDNNRINKLKSSTDVEYNTKLSQDINVRLHEPINIKLENEDTKEKINSTTIKTTEMVNITAVTNQDLSQNIDVNTTVVDEQRSVIDLVYDNSTSYKNLYVSNNTNASIFSKFNDKMRAIINNSEQPVFHSNTFETAEDSVTKVTLAYEQIYDPLKMLRTSIMDKCYEVPKLRGFDVTETRISWAHHPDGPSQIDIDEARGLRVRLPSFNDHPVVVTVPPSITRSYPRFAHATALRKAPRTARSRIPRNMPRTEMPTEKDINFLERQEVQTTESMDFYKPWERYRTSDHTYDNVYLNILFRKSSPNPRPNTRPQVYQPPAPVVARPANRFGLVRRPVIPIRSYHKINK